MKIAAAPEVQTNVLIELSRAPGVVFSYQATLTQVYERYIVEDQIHAGESLP